MNRTPRAWLIARRCVGAALLLGASAACGDKPAPSASPAAPAAVSTPRAPSKPAPDRVAKGVASNTTMKDLPDTVDGYQVIRARTKEGELASMGVKAPQGWQVVQPPNGPDPHAGKFSLDEATKGLDKKGTLAAQIETNMGSFYCDLFADKAPNTVANFVGLARGLRKFWDAEKLAWVARPYYERSAFHRVMPTFMIQGGDHTGTGQGFIGYSIPDELSPQSKHDRPGQLCMANRMPGHNEGQFFITEAAAPHLDASYTIFGQCEPVTLVQRIARVPQSGPPDNRPLTPVVIEHVKIKRVEGGAAAWMPASAKLPPMPGLPPPGRAVEAPAKSP